jgi:hypothetical protein
MKVFCYTKNMLRNVFVLFFFTALMAGISFPVMAAVEVVSLGYLEATGTYTNINESDDDYGSDVTAFYSPVLKFSDTFFIIPLLDVHFNSYPQYLPQDEGNSFYNTYFVTNIHLAMRKEFKPGWFSKITAIGTRNSMKETPEDNWGDGLYDYTDIGFNKELRHIIKDETSEKSYAASFQYYKRKYPNFATLISTTTVTPPEIREKDYNGFKYLARAEHYYFGRGGWHTEPYLLHKAYSDKHTVKEDGTLDLGEDRRDYEFGFNFGGVYLPQKFQGVNFSLDNSYVYNKSNMSYYDTRNTLSLTDDVFTEDYYDYQSFSVSPGFEYVHPVAEEKEIKFRLGYGFLYRLYGGRKAQDSAGNYKSDEQNDREHTYSAGLRIPMTKSADFVTDYAYTHVLSNQKYEDFYRYTIASYTIKTGISWSF